MRIIFSVVATALLCGCANHPIVDDRTHLSTYDIVHKVRCEAAEKIAEYATGWDYVGGDRERKALAKRIEAFDQSLKPKLKRKAELNLAINTYNADATRLNRKGGWLYSQIKVIEAQGENLVADELAAQNELRVKLIALNQGETAERLDAAIRSALKLRDIQRAVREKKTELARLKGEYEHIEKLKTLLKEDIKDERRAVEAIEEDEKAGKVLRTRLARKELGVVKEFYETSIAMQFFFDITETNKNQATGSVKFPIHFGSATINYNAGLDKIRQSERTVGIEAKFGELIALHQSSCADAVRTDDERARKYPITGNTGMGELIEQYVQLALSRDEELRGRLFKTTSSVGNKKLFTERLKFTTTLSGGVNPTIDLSPTKLHSIKFGLDLDVERKDIHEVIVDIAPPASDGGGGAAAGGATTVNVGTVPEVGIRVINDPYVLAPGPSLSAGH